MAAYAQLVVLVPIAISRGHHFSYDACFIIIGLVLRLISNAILMLVPAGPRWPHQLAMALLGVGVACRAAFVSFAGAVLPLRVFLRIASYKRAVNLTGYVIGGLVAFGLKRTGACWPAFFWVAQGALALTLITFVAGLRVGVSDRTDCRTEQCLRRSDLRALVRVGARHPAVLAASAWYQLTLASFEVVSANTSSIIFVVDPEADSNGLVLALGRLLSGLATVAFGVRLQSAGLGMAPAMVGSAVAATLVAALAYCRSAVGAYVGIIGVSVVLEPCFCTILVMIANSVPESLRKTAIFVNVAGSLLVHAVVQAAAQVGNLPLSDLLLIVSAVLVLSTVIMACCIIMRPPSTRST